jgi:hypothetical protein
LYGARQRPSHLICGLCPSITDTTFALQFPHMLIIHAVLNHDVSLEDVARSKRVVAPSGTVLWRLPARTSRAVAGDGLPVLSGSAPGLLPELLSIVREAPVSGCLSHERFTYGAPGENRTHDLRFRNSAISVHWRVSNVVAEYVCRPSCASGTLPVHSRSSTLGVRSGVNGDQPSPK